MLEMISVFHGSDHIVKQPVYLGGKEDNDYGNGFYATECDIIKGYRADDSYTQVIEAFLLNQINLYEVERLFYKGSLGNQIFLKSEGAFQISILVCNGNMACRHPKL